MREDSRLFRYSVWLLLTLNLCVALFPVVPNVRGGYFFDQIHKELYRDIVFFVSPVIVGLLIIHFLFQRWRNKTRVVVNKPIMLATVLTFVALNLSLAMHGYREGKLTAVYFLGMSFFLFAISDFYRMPLKSLMLIRWVLAFWAILPLGLVIVFPSLSEFFIDAGHSFHGFADSHVGYGLWVGLLIILLLKQPDGYWKKWLLLAAAMAGLFLSQSRAAIGALAICYLYSYFVGHANNYGKFLRKSLIVLVVCWFTLVVWQHFLGRSNALAVNPFSPAFDVPRAEIFKRFFEFIRNNWLFGYGGQYGVDVAAIGRGISAHNLLVQTLANYGALVLLGYFLYLIVIFLDIKNITSRMVLIFLLLYSQMEPVLDPVNYLSPIAIIWFMAIVMLQKEKVGLCG